MRWAVACVLICACNGQFRFDEPDASVPACKRDSDCKLPSLHCDVTGGTCVECLADTECTRAEAPHCALDLHECVPCTAASQCGDAGSCEPATHRCFQTCADTDDCQQTASIECEREKSMCVACERNTNCAASPGTPICDPNIGQCVECSLNTHCPEDKPICDRRNGRCVRCVSPHDCAAGQLCDPQSRTCL